MYISEYAVTMLQGDMLFSQAVYKINIVPVNGDSRIDIVITYYRLIKHHLSFVLIFVVTNASLIRELDPLF